jgi:uncharacterized RDD family membrane protein YckC
MTLIRKVLVLIVLILLTALSIGSGTVLAWRAVLHAAQSQVRAVASLPAPEPTSAPSPAAALAAAARPTGRAPAASAARALAAPGAPGAARTPQAPEAPDAPLAPAAPMPGGRVLAAQPAGSAAQTSPADGVEIRRIARPAFRLGQDYRLRAGETVREVVVISGAVTIEGTVQGDVVVVVGRVHLGSTAIIHGNLTVVGGSLDIESGADVRRELVVIGGGFNAPPDFSAGGQHVVIGDSLIGHRIDAIVPWITTGLLWGRPLVLGIGWVWTVVFVCFLVYLIVALVFDRSVKTCTETLVRRPLGSFMAGLLVLLLFGPVLFILAVSVVGIAVVPFVLCAMVIAWIVGKVAVFRWIGASVLAEDESSRKIQGVRSFAIGFVTVTIIYLVPILGLIAWATLGVWSLGAASLAAIAALRRENPNGSRRRVVKPSTPPEGGGPAGAPPFVPQEPPATPAPAASTSAIAYDAPSVAFAATDAPGTFDLPPAPPAPVSASEPPAASASWASGAGVGAGQSRAAGQAGHIDPWAAVTPADLITMPHAPFLHRAAAFGLDIVLVLFITGFFTPRVMRGEAEQFFFLLLVYHVAFWTWKATTVGGIICNLRLVRTDGGTLSFADALLRGLAAIFSLVCAGLGALWILKDPEQQSWHDRIAGTYVVKVPRSYGTR